MGQSTGLRMIRNASGLKSCLRAVASAGQEMPADKNRSAERSALGRPEGHRRARAAAGGRAEPQ